MSRAGRHGRPAQADLVYLSAEPSVSHNLVAVVRVLTVLLNFRSSASQTSLLSIPPPPISPVSGIVIVSRRSSPYSGDLSTYAASSFSLTSSLNTSTLPQSLTLKA